MGIKTKFGSASCSIVSSCFDNIDLRLPKITAWLSFIHLLFVLFLLSFVLLHELIRDHKKMVGSNFQSNRVAKNVAEKQRRDKINGFINDLANIVPIMPQSVKKLDKSNILRLSASYLRLHQCKLTFDF